MSLSLGARAPPRSRRHWGPEMTRSALRPPSPGARPPEPHYPNSRKPQLSPGQQIRSEICTPKQRPQSQSCGHSAPPANLSPPDGGPAACDRPSGLRGPLGLPGPARQQAALPGMTGANAGPRPRLHLGWPLTRAAGSPLGAWRGVRRAPGCDAETRRAFDFWALLRATWRVPLPGHRSSEGFIFMPTS